MPVLPLIDLLLLSGWTSLLIGFVLKMVYLTSSYRPTILSLRPIDFLIVAGAAMLFAIALAARTWVVSQMPAVSAARRRDETMEAYRALHNGDDEAEAAQAAQARQALEDAAQRANQASLSRRSSRVAHGPSRERPYCVRLRAASRDFEWSRVRLDARQTPIPRSPDPRYKTPEHDSAREPCSGAMNRISVRLPTGSGRAIDRTKRAA